MYCRSDISYIIYHVSHIIYDISHITHHISYIIYHISHITYHVSHMMYHISHIMYHISRITFHMSYTIYHVSRITYHMSHLIFHISRITYHISYTTYHKSYMIYQFLSCYFQLPRFGPIQWVHMTPHETHRSVWLNSFGVLPFLFLLPPAAMMGVARAFFERVVVRVLVGRWVLQYLTPEELHRLEVRWGTTVFKFVLQGRFRPKL